MPDPLQSLRSRLEEFAKERDWGRFHNPKNLVMAIAGEAGELLAELQWKTNEEIAAGLKDDDFKSQLGREMADVLIYLIRLADVCQIDLVQAANGKIDLNEARYPVEVAAALAAKYDKLRGCPS